MAYNPEFNIDEAAITFTQAVVERGLSLRGDPPYGPESYQDLADRALAAVAYYTGLSQANAGMALAAERLRKDAQRTAEQLLRD